MAKAAAMLTDLIVRIGHYGFRRTLGVIAGAGIALRIVLRMAHGTANYHGEGYGFFFDLAAGLAAGFAAGSAGSSSNFSIGGAPS